MRDTTYRGGADYFYRLRIGEFPGATTAFPLAVQRGKTAKVGFAGPGTADIPPVTREGPDRPDASRRSTSPRSGPAASSGWPVPVRAQRLTRVGRAGAEQRAGEGEQAAGARRRVGEVRARPATSTTSPSPARRAQKYAVDGDDLRDQLAGRGAHPRARRRRARSSAAATRRSSRRRRRVHARRPTATTSSPASTSTTCSGPNEMYHLSVVPVDAGLHRHARPRPLRGRRPAAARRCWRPSTRLNGYAGPVELSIVGDAASERQGRRVPAGQTIAFVPLTGEGRDEAGGATRSACRATAKIDGKDVVRFGTLTDVGEDRPRRDAEPAAGAAERLRGGGDREAGVRAEADRRTRRPSRRGRRARCWSRRRARRAPTATSRSPRCSRRRT